MMSQKTLSLDEEVDNGILRKTINALQKDGPLSHEELSDRLEYNWAETQKVVRELRNRDIVLITLDRRYEWNERDEKLQSDTEK